MTAREFTLEWASAEFTASERIEHAIVPPISRGFFDLDQPPNPTAVVARRCCHQRHELSDPDTGALAAVWLPSEPDCRIAYAASYRVRGLTHRLTLRDIAEMAEHLWGAE